MTTRIYACLLLALCGCGDSRDFASERKPAVQRYQEQVRQLYLRRNGFYLKCADSALVALNQANEQIQRSSSQDALKVQSLMLRSEVSRLSEEAKLRQVERTASMAEIQATNVEIGKIFEQTQTSIQESLTKMEEAKKTWNDLKPPSEVQKSVAKIEKSVKCISILQGMPPIRPSPRTENL